MKNHEPKGTMPAKPDVIRSLIGDDDLHLFNEGTHRRLWNVLGSHPDPAGGTHFAVWAPNARRVSVIGDFNGWDPAAGVLQARGGSGIWEGHVPKAGEGSVYKYRIEGPTGGWVGEKADPFGFMHEEPPATASIVTSLDFQWSDEEWMEARRRDHRREPMSIYEVHLGSWRRVPEEGNRPLTYREMAAPLASHVKGLGFTHVELLPIFEHPFYGSWGYQVTGFFAPTSRYGTPQDLMYMIDHLHGEGIGVILDWVPSHFPSDAHGLSYFDGTHLFEHEDPRQGFHPDWNSLIFNYGRDEVRSFLLSSAMFWLQMFHVDALRVDAVASMLYLDYSRKQGEWIPNMYGGRENLEAISFLRRMNEDVYSDVPGAETIAEESTAWPMVSRPIYVGGLGFGFKWDMGWMHDTLSYMRHDPVHRRYHHNQLTFRMMYAWSENFVLSLSHDEVVHGKGSLWGKMPGDDWQKAANLRLLYSYMWMQPGKKLLFMGCEFGQHREWSHERSLDWHLLEHPLHGGLQLCLGDLNRIYRENPLLYENDVNPDGFEWIDANDTENSVLSFIRWDSERRDPILCVFNFTPQVRWNYQLGVPFDGVWEELLNTDSPSYGGSGQGNFGSVEASPVGRHGRPRSVTLTLPPLACVLLRRKAES